MAGGQPVSMANVRELRACARRAGSRSSSTRPGWSRTPSSSRSARRATPTKSIAEILLEFCSFTDGAWMSAKKDNLVNIGGWLAVNDWDTFEELRNLVVVYEGLHTYGGMAGRDMEALAIGIEESVQDEHVRSRGRPGPLSRRAARASGTSRSSGRSAGTRSSSTRRRFYPHLAQDVFPAQTLAAELYLDSGIRVDGARHRVGRPRPEDRRPQAPEARADAPDDPAPRLHAGPHGRRGRIGQGVSSTRATTRKGLAMVYEPKYLRFFQARFEPLA